MIICGIDPGPTRSAYVIYDTDTRQLRSTRAFPAFGKVDNGTMSAVIMEVSFDWMAIERIAHMGMPSVGEDIFDTVEWIGRFIEMRRNRGNWERVKRHQVKMHLCGSMKAKDGNIRQALIDRYGGKDAAIGKKHTPGPLFGLSGDCWSALAVAITFSETLLPAGEIGDTK